MTDHTARHNLIEDLRGALPRRRFLALAGAGAASLPVLSACTTEGGTATTATGSSACVIWPEETNGPYPADGSNSANGSLANVLISSGIVRQDMRSSFAGLTGTAEGVPVRLRLQLVDSTNACTPLAGYVIYAWHCDAAGDYSVYNLKSQNYLRAVGVADETGLVTFDTIYPGCYMGRVPHVHFEVYPSLEKATEYGNRLLCSQFGFPDAWSEKIYSGVSDYAESVRPFNQISLATDNVFGDNTDAQLSAQIAAMSGDVASTLVADLVVGIDPDAEAQAPRHGRGADRRGPPPGPPPDGMPPMRPGDTN